MSNAALWVAGPSWEKIKADTIARLEREPAPSLGAPTPAWGWLFVTACGLIPVVTLGGIIPFMVGLGGARLCVTTARDESISAIGRVILCLGIMAGCWIVVAALLVVLALLLR